MHYDEYADLYLRLSLDRDGKTAIERQELDCREWAERNGLKVREVHIDRGRSGYRKDVERAGFNAALAAVTSGVVGTLVVFKLDRLSRQGMEQVGLVLDAIENVGGRLVSVHDGLDSSSANARLLIATLSELARAESANMGLRIRNAKEHLRGSGRWIGGQAPYGLVARDGRMNVDPETGPIVREIARRVLDGTPLTQVTRWLNAEKIPSPRGGTWAVGSVAQILRGPATAGLLPETIKKPDGSGYTSVVRPWRNPETGETVSIMAEGQDPLVSPADQARIVALFVERTRLWLGGRVAGPRGESRHLLTGLLRCAGCGARASKQGNSYRCQSARLGRPCEAPAGVYQPALDDAVTTAWLQRLTTAAPGDPLLVAVAEGWVARHDPEAVERRRCVLFALDQERAAVASLDDDFYMHRSIDRERYDRVAEALSRRIEELTRTLDANPIPEADISALRDPVRVRETWAVADVRERRALLRLALVEVRICQGVRGQRFDPETRLSCVWATAPPTVTGANAATIAEELGGCGR